MGQSCRVGGARGVGQDRSQLGLQGPGKAQGVTRCSQSRLRHRRRGSDHVTGAWSLLGSVPSAQCVAAPAAILCSQGPSSVACLPGGQVRDPPHADLWPLWSLLWGTPHLLQEGPPSFTVYTGVLGLCVCLSEAWLGPALAGRGTFP